MRNGPSTGDWLRFVGGLSHSSQNPRRRRGQLWNFVGTDIESLTIEVTGAVFAFNGSASVNSVEIWGKLDSPNVCSDLCSSWGAKLWLYTLNGGRPASDRHREHNTLTLNPPTATMNSRGRGSEATPYYGPAPSSCITISTNIASCLGPERARLCQSHASGRNRSLSDEGQRFYR
jgi:hypothetical protein